MKTYTVRTPCECAGAWRVPGKPFHLTDEQARYLAPPYGSVVTPVENDDGRQHGRKRANRPRPERLATRPAVDRENTDDATGQPGDEA